MKKPCPRCGRLREVRIRDKADLCQDCRDVTKDLDEQDTWITVGA